MVTPPDDGDVLVARLRAAGCVWAEEEAELLLGAADGPVGLEQLVRRRVGGEPIELVVGWVEFAGLALRVGPGVFVPRRRTELLARAALARVGPGQVVVEMCCGVAPVAAVVAAAAGSAVGELHVCDTSRTALAWARANVPSATVHHGDLFDALPGDLAGRVDVLVANAPYVPTEHIASMPPEARDHEPLEALDGGSDGVEVHRRLAGSAPSWLAPGGVLLVECGAGQVPLTSAAMTAAGLEVEVQSDAKVGGWVVAGRSAQRS